MPYAPQLCTRSPCAEGRNCLFAHSEEEILYHPKTYKVTSCQSCRGFYCPYAHGHHELRQGVEASKKTA